MYSCETVDKGACITRMGAVRNYSTNCNGKKQGEGRGERVKDMEFSGLLEK